MWANSQETADLVRFTKDIFNGKLHFLHSGRAKTLTCYLLHSLLSKSKSFFSRTVVLKTNTHNKHEMTNGG